MSKQLEPEKRLPQQLESKQSKRSLRLLAALLKLHLLQRKGELLDLQLKGSKLAEGPKLKAHKPKRG